MSADLCPCCGQPLPGSHIEIAKSVGLSGRETDIFLTIAAASGQPVAWSVIADTVYADDADGGPMNPSQVVRSLVSRCNQKLRLTDLRILNNWGAGYRLASVKRVVAQ